jgi:CheY-specific phosphatase CheX
VVKISHDSVERAAREVLETSAGSKVVAVTHHDEADGDFAELIGTLSLLGKMGGTLVVHCAWPQAVQLASGMLGGDPDPDREMVHDALGEMVNQIGGTIKRHAQANDSDLLLSPPVVVSGSPLRHCVKSSATPMSVELALEGGSFFVALWPA